MLENAPRPKSLPIIAPPWHRGRRHLPRAPSRLARDAGLATVRNAAHTAYLASCALAVSAYELSVKFMRGPLAPSSKNRIPRESLHLVSIEREASDHWMNFQKIQF